MSSSTLETEDLENLPAGTYSLTVTDANECREVVGFMLTQASDFTVAGQAVTPGCVDAQARRDGRLVLTTYEPTWRYAISEGGSFTPVVAQPGDLPVVPTDGLLRTDLPNPTDASGQPYTIRLFTAEGCIKDLTLTVLPATCICPPPTCLPIKIRKIKG